MARALFSALAHAMTPEEMRPGVRRGLIRHFFVTPLGPDAGHRIPRLRERAVDVLARARAISDPAVLYADAGGDFSPTRLRRQQG